MATWYLLNTIRFADSKGLASILKAGKLIDDSKVNLPAIQASGGMVAPSSYPTVAANALLAQGLAKDGAVGIDFTSEADRMMLAAFMVDKLGLEQNRGSSTAAAGATVAAAAAISTAVVVTPKYSGKLRVRAWASAEGLTSGTFTPVLQNGSTAIAAPAQYTGNTDAMPCNVECEIELTGLALGTAVTINWVTTSGDATVTLGNGSTGKGAALFVTEVP